MKQILLAAFAAMPLMVGCAMAESNAEKLVRTISVTGEGETTAKPDMATMQIGVDRKAVTARAALQANSEAMDAAIGALKKAGVAQKDMQTSNVSLYPDYVYDRQAEEQRLRGYRASNTLTVKFRDLDKMGSVLEAAVASGANELRGISFGFTDPKPLFEKARTAAVKDAKAKASLYAEAAGVRLGDLITIGEPGLSMPVALKQAEADVVRVTASRAVPIQAGENAVRAQVNVIYAID